MSVTYTLRPYQQEALDTLYKWWLDYLEGVPLLVQPTGAGKSLVIAELVRLIWDTWGEQLPRCLVIVPSKELAEQNAEKLRALLPGHRSVSFYSAALGKKNPHGDVIVATIGSVYRAAHVLGNIKAVIIDEAHLISPDGAEAGRYRQLLTDLAKLCTFRVVGLTATPFRGNGIWLTDGKDPLFTGIAHEVKMGALIEQGYLSPLVLPDTALTRIDADDVTISRSTGDYDVGELDACVGAFLPGIVDDAFRLAADRKKWIAFTPAVASAEHLVDMLNAAGISAALVCGSTPKKERADLIADFRAGRLRCLVTVLALAVGFDVPDVDCIIWARPTRSPVLYVQGAGRATRIAPGKRDALWLDFSDTTARMGPVDAIRGRKRVLRNTEDVTAPFAVCDACGFQVRPANLQFCPECGHQLREDEADARKAVSDAAVMLSQIRVKLITYDVTDVRYSIHKKDGSPDSLRVDYYSGLRRVASEWVCFDHTGWARGKAEQWWQKMTTRWWESFPPPPTTNEAYHWAQIESPKALERPTTITVNESGKYPEIVGYSFNQREEDAA
jgi:DNA repair protein RadD